MKNCPLVTFAAVAILLPATAFGRDISAQIIAAEDAYNQALVRGDWRTIEKMESEDFVFTGDDGSVKGRSHQIDVLKSGSVKFEEVKASDVKVQDLGDVAVATGRLVEKGHYENDDIGGTYRFTDVWVKR